MPFQCMTILETRVAFSFMRLLEGFFKGWSSRLLHVLVTVNSAAMNIGVCANYGFLTAYAHK